MKQFLLLPLLLLAACAPKTAPTPQNLADSIAQGTAVVDSLTIKKQISALTLPGFQGRKAGKAPNAAVRQYLVAELLALGYVPQLDTFSVVRAKYGNVQPCLDSVVVRLTNLTVCLPGTDPRRIVAVGAHYDHLGVDEGQIYPGADDNASGVAAVLQLAAAFRAAPYRPQATVLFCLWDGEEIGLCGSKHFVAADPRAKHVEAYLNFDMIGRNPDQPCAYMYSASCDSLRTYAEQAVDQLQLDSALLRFAPIDDFKGGSDFAPFGRAGIPIAAYHTGGHPDFHRPTDTADKIAYGRTADLTRSAFYVLWRLSER